MGEVPEFSPEVYREWVERQQRVVARILDELNPDDVHECVGEELVD